MSGEMKAFKSWKAAEKYANGTPIVRIGRLFVCGFRDTLDARLSEISLFSHITGGVCATVTLGHLDRLGNANYALPGTMARFGMGGGRLFPEA